MDDILASIRRIIADDQSRQGAAARGPQRPGSNGAVAQPDGAAAKPPPVAPAPPMPSSLATRPGVAADLPPQDAPSSSAFTRAGDDGAPRRPPVAGRVSAPNGGAPHLNPPPPVVVDRAVFDEIASIGAAAATLGSSRTASSPTEASASTNGMTTSLDAREAAAPVNGFSITSSAEVLVVAVDSEPRRAPSDETPVQQTATSAGVPPSTDAEPLVSADAVTAIEHSFQALATSVFMQNAGQLDVVVRDLLRPMLKTWLDDNLPIIVERLVRTEIERVARGGRT